MPRKSATPLTLPAPDSAGRFKITVTNEDIEKGRRNECMRCPVARALARSLRALNPGRRLWVEVMPSEVAVYTPDTREFAYRRMEAIYLHDGVDFIFAFDKRYNHRETFHETKVTFWGLR